jgi:hypothetical protein
MIEHRTVYREAGRYAGWPANYGMWAWGEEIVACFTVGYVQEDAGFHARDRARPFVTLQARSMDGGLTWTSAPMPCRTPGNRGLSADEHMRPELWVAAFMEGEYAPEIYPGRIDFTHADFALMCARTGLEAGAVSWFYVTTDRARSWQGPYWLPDFGQPGIAARTDYVVTGRNACLLWLTAAKRNGQEGRVLCAETRDGGKHFVFKSWVMPEPEGYAIMPTSLWLVSGRLLTAVRCSGARNATGQRASWIDLYASDDGGEHWQWIGQPVADTGRGGNPPALTHLQDGRLGITYGYRNPPYAICAVLSEDAGQTWSAPRFLRTGAGNHDIGYPRTVQRADGALVTVYYWNDHPDGERYITATLWEI